MQELTPFDLQFFAKKEDGETPPPTKAKGKKKRETAGPKKSRSSSSRKKKTSDFTDDELIRYVVQPGDTIYNLARRFHTTPRRICELNKLHKPTLLIPGDVIVLPEDF